MKHPKINKEFKEALKNEIAPLLIGLRNELSETNGALSRALEKGSTHGIELVLNGENVPMLKGRDGYTPVKGKDFFDGQDGRNGKDGKNGKNGARGMKGADGKDGKKGLDGRDGRDGKDGKHGITKTVTEFVEISPIDIRDKLESLKGGSRLSMKAIKGLQEIIDKMSLSGGRGGDGGIGGSGSVTGSTTFAGLTDVSVAGVAVDQSVKWNGTAWVPFDPSTASGSSTYFTNVTATQSGANAVIDLTQLGATYSSMLFPTRNGQVLRVTSDYTLSGLTLTILNADATESFSVAWSGTSATVSQYTSARWPYPTAGDDVEVLNTATALTITKVTATVKGSGTSATIQLQKHSASALNSAGTDMLASSLVATASGANTTSFSSATLAIGDFMSLVVSSVSGTPTAVVLRIEFTIS
jgi:hypothetical protein